MFSKEQQEEKLLSQQQDEEPSTGQRPERKVQEIELGSTVNLNEHVTIHDTAEERMKKQCKQWADYVKKDYEHDETVRKFAYKLFTWINVEFMAFNYSIWKRDDGIRKLVEEWNALQGSFVSAKRCFIAHCLMSSLTLLGMMFNSLDNLRDIESKVNTTRIFQKIQEIDRRWNETLATKSRSNAFGKYVIPPDQFEQFRENDYFDAAKSSLSGTDFDYFESHQSRYLTIKKFVMSNLPFFLDGDKKNDHKPIRQVMKQIYVMSEGAKSTFNTAYESRVMTLHTRLTRHKQWEWIFLSWGIRTDYVSSAKGEVDRPSDIWPPLAQIICSILTTAAENMIHNDTSTSITTSNTKSKSRTKSKSKSRTKSKSQSTSTNIRAKSKSKRKSKRKSKSNKAEADSSASSDERRLVWQFVSGEVGNRKFKFNITRKLFIRDDPHCTTAVSEEILKKMITGLQANNFEYSYRYGKVLWKEIKRLREKKEKTDELRTTSMDSFVGMMRTLHAIMMELVFRREFCCSKSKVKKENQRLYKILQESAKWAERGAGPKKQQEFAATKWVKLHYNNITDLVDGDIVGIKRTKIIPVIFKCCHKAYISNKVIGVNYVELPESLDTNVRYLEVSEEKCNVYVHEFVKEQVVNKALQVSF